MLSNPFLVTLLILFAIEIGAGENVDEFKVVQIKSGKIRGKLMPSFDGKRNFFGFRGIPYAKPPLAELRFKAPVEPEPWKGIRDALNYGSVCVQKSHIDTDVVGNEDCLTINVFTPDLSPVDPLPVLVFIHGGAYYFGSGQWFGPEFLMNENLIVVTFNYRLGPFGFLALESPEYSGNAGLKDQLLALQWVHQNIYRFGGDNARITLFGHSAGASSAHLLSLLPQSRGLIKRAILASGSALVPWAFSGYRSHNEILTYVAKEAGYTVSSELELIAFLKTIDANDLMNGAYLPAYIPGIIPKAIDLIWAPVIEDSQAMEPLLTHKPEHYLFRKNSSSEIDTLFGFVNMESFGFTGPEQLNPQLLQSFDETFTIQLPLRAITYDYNSDIYRTYSNEIRQYYFGESKIAENIPAYNALLSDVFFVYGIDKAVKCQSRVSRGKTYYYKFSVDHKFNPFFGLANVSFPGSTHGDELFYIFKLNNSIVPPEIYGRVLADSNEVKVIQRMTRMLSRFAANGNPNLDESEETIWKPVRNNIIHYANITNEKFNLEVSPHEANMAFWDEFFIKHQDTLKINNSDLSIDELFLVTGHYE